ncbi:diaminopimelate decarboxylase [Candidatus Haliotispira prima]|uniref:Diaminopimelate decarboxylase n=1 Tax=Candidatus Haliotispira prima TaxID=3034016 RepID=A0ABY8MHZ4_9SPIO|nr:diaminopimelate decarboxylase [Candidatus Haliotispira prima]
MTSRTDAKTDLFLPDLAQARLAIEQAGSPVYLSDVATVLERLQRMRRDFPENTKIFYAMKANYNPDLLKALLAAGLDGVDTVSPHEIRMALLCGFRKEQIIFTGNYSGREELAQVLELGVLCNIGSLMELELLGQLKEGGSVAVRLKPSVGAGEFKGTITGGEDSKFGISLQDLPEVQTILQHHRLQLVGLHCHIGSGFYQTTEFETAVRSILHVAKGFVPLQFIDCGGGFGARYHSGKEGLDLSSFAKAITPALEEFRHDNRTNPELRLEPGKFLVAESTVLLCRVTTINLGESCIFVGTDTGFNHLIRPAFYGAYHHAVNLSGEAEGRKRQTVKIVGNICESSDIMVEKVEIAEAKSGDIIALQTAGAYGASMHSLYNLRSAPGEALVMTDGSLVVSRKRETQQQGFDRLLRALNYRTL